MFYDAWIVGIHPVWGLKAEDETQPHVLHAGETSFCQIVDFDHVGLKMDCTTKRGLDGIIVTLGEAWDVDKYLWCRCGQQTFLHIW